MCIFSLISSILTMDFNLSKGGVFCKPFSSLDSFPVCKEIAGCMLATLLLYIPASAAVFGHMVDFTLSQFPCSPAESYKFNIIYLTKKNSTVNQKIQYIEKYSLKILYMPSGLIRLRIKSQQKENSFGKNM